MSAQKTNSAIILAAVVVACAIALYAVLGRGGAKPAGPADADHRPPKLEPPVVDPRRPDQDPPVTQIDQTTDTTKPPERPETGDQPLGASPTPNLLDAAERGDLEAIGAMLEQGADVNQVDAAGRTALMAAAGAGKIDAVFLLLNSGADPEPRDQARRSARDYALARFDASGKTIARVLDDALGPAPVTEPKDK
ncbi:MAG: ankyrin repeat domain-containing protein [Phycisphaerales bacterium]|nr:ankyrin repeat domain-containing protein [Phycisphaerales bacterium]